MKKISIYLYICICFCIIVITSSATSNLHNNGNNEASTSEISLHQDEPFNYDGLRNNVFGNNITFRDDNIMLLNGEPFFPIGRYTYAFNDNYSCTILYKKIPCFIDNLAYDTNMISAAVTNSGINETIYNESLQCLDNPRFLGWYIADEPVWMRHNDQEYFEQLLEVYYNLKADDPGHLVWMNFAAADRPDDVNVYIQNRRQWSQAADVISVDVYPKWLGPASRQCCAGDGRFCVLDNCEISVVGDYVDLLINEVTMGEKPVWMVTQAWGDVNEHEIMFMEWQAIIHGATGIWNWFGPHEYGPVQPDADNAANKLRELHDLLVARTVDATVTHTAGIETMVKEVDDEYVIFAVYREPDPVWGVTAYFDVSSLGITADGYASLIQEDEVREIHNGCFDVHFDPFDTHIIQLKKWWDYDWNSSMKIHINHSLIAEDQSDFPVFIHLLSHNDLAEIAQNDGSDIAFIDSTNSIQLDHEIEYYDTVSGELLAWVRVPYLSSINNTTLYLYYGNPDCGTQENISGVWDSNYIGIWHMDEPDGDIVDSTGTKNGSVIGSPSYQQDGLVHQSIYFDGVNVEYFNITDDRYKFNTEDVTLEIVVFYQENRDFYEPVLYLGDPDNYPQMSIQKYRSGHLLHNGKLFCVNLQEGGPYDEAYSLDGGDSYTGRWMYQVGRYERGAETALLLNGLLMGSDTCHDNDLAADGKFIARIGHGGMGYVPPSMKGYIDEVRISTIARSQSWINTTYHTMNDPEHFIHFLTTKASGPNHGLNDEYIKFIGSASWGSPPYFWHWDFGDGDTSTLRKPAHLFLYPDNYTVTLTVTDGLGQITVNTTSIHIEMAPFQGIAEGPRYGFPGENTYMKGSASGGILPYNWTWDFGDGNISHEQTPNYSYHQLGEFTVTLTVVDAWDHTVNDTFSILILPHPPSVYIDDNYHEDTPGFGYDHFNSIQDGIDVVADNGTVYVNNGTYNENLHIGTPMNLIGEDKETTIIDGKYNSHVITLQETCNVNISNFTTQHGTCGIFILQTNSSVISEISIKDNEYAGIYLQDSSHNRILRNSIDAFAESSINGIELSSSVSLCCNNTISNNRVTNCDIGIFLAGSSVIDNTVAKNTIIKNSYGICLAYESEDNNLIYLNTFINNNQHAMDYSFVECVNYWDNGTKGNYWDDYGDSYPQVDFDGDGCWDTPYEILGLDEVWDNYPLAEPWDMYYRNIKDFPYYVAEEIPGIGVQTGAAVGSMLLDYVCWDKVTHPGEFPLLLFDQQDVFNWFTAYNKTEEGQLLDWFDDPDPQNITAFDMAWGLQGNSSEYGYNYLIHVDPEYLPVLRSICAIIDLSLGEYGTNAPDIGHPTNIPAVVPIYGNYNRWIVIKGIHTDKSPWSGMPEVYPYELPYSVYGFWIHDPYPLEGGIGQNTYTTAIEFTSTYYYPLTLPGNPYEKNNYVAVVEPPEDFNISKFKSDGFNIAESSCMLSQNDRKAIHLATKMGHKAPKIVKKIAEKTLITRAGNILNDLARFDSSIKSYAQDAQHIQTIIVHNYVSSGNDYAIVIFNSKTGTSAVRISLETGVHLETSTSSVDPSVYLKALSINNNDQPVFGSYMHSCISPFYPIINNGCML